MHPRSVVAFALTALLGGAGLGCGVEQLPPARPPPRTLPAEVVVPVDPPPPGRGRVILDTDGEPASVAEITSGTLGSSGGGGGGNGDPIAFVKPLCTTPCVVDLPYGSHPILLRSTADATHQSETELDVGARARVFRHTLGERTDGGGVRVVGASVLTLGILAVAAGVVMWGAGAASSHGAPSLVTGGEILTAGGSGGVLLSIPFLLMGRPTERPGATTQWSLPGAALPARAAEPVLPARASAAADRL